jgi:hypothetical protein
VLHVPTTFPLYFHFSLWFGKKRLNILSSSRLWLRAPSSHELCCGLLSEELEFIQGGRVTFCVCHEELEEWRIRGEKLESMDWVNLLIGLRRIRIR